MIRLQDIDLNLLVVFQLMYRERKTGAVAEQLGLTQPAISNALARLRLALHDELFERTARGMRPTPFADSIAESVSYALSTLQDGLNYQERFDPQSSDRVFCVNMTDLGEIHMLPRLMAYLAEHAPNLSISTVRDNGHSLREELETGSVDLAIGLLPQLEAGFYQRRLFDQEYVCLVREGHPLAEQTLTLDNFSKSEHIIIEAQDTGHGRVEKQLAKSGILRVSKLKLPHFISAPYIIAHTDLVATVTEKLALQMANSLDLVIKPHPVDIPAAQINMFWHRRFHQDSGNVWLRNVFFELFSE
ncbi:LysR family transcriptional regulator [Marinomonas mediterranea]|jgi:transcriptional regulator, LysR family|uniref:Transcriptional regulator, LysR family n=1 Tax=Marinomonas mediterranea (strain ATCC 700492 / JCM 21426 / NBRC 103028 / MMB-1) TaxID=717774 RepID=F2K4P0_MARM1|nr:LysR family transcriptional regulator [Marinomonas mediterranea]ADZ91433.1 transcriptional regulator, LysR family [Marinomonas mediterranea MMB-1]WCN09400.1 LysR family transcriptional regulator [Marinomonas mediterranea]WCN13477.1 LysR family transcriptional regulator [Marinomonas mediterranea]WCN17542.1 LysR family transcriptional regulator [Marinomonas mediterranea MMB-1]